MSVTPVTVEIPAGSSSMQGTLFAAQTPRAVAVMNGATGVPHRYYRHFAAWLAETQNITCLTYDYRGFGASAQGHIRDVSLRMADWGITDQQAARDWLAANTPDTPLWVIGHSLGGFMLAHQRPLPQVARIIAICSGPVHLRDHPMSHQLQIRFFWFVLGPTLIRLYGYLPAGLSGLGAAIPAQVFWQWRKWCTTRGFHHNDPSLPRPDLEQVTAPLYSFALSDDEMMPPAAVQRLSTLYPAAAHHHSTLTPTDFGLNKVGHIAAFARQNAALWPRFIAG